MYNGDLIIKTFLLSILVLHRTSCCSLSLSPSKALLASSRASPRRAFLSLSAAPSLSAFTSPWSLCTSVSRIFMVLANSTSCCRARASRADAMSRSFSSWSLARRSVSATACLCCSSSRACRCSCSRSRSLHTWEGQSRWEYFFQPFFFANCTSFQHGRPHKNPSKPWYFYFHLSCTSMTVAEKVEESVFVSWYNETKTSFLCGVIVTDLTAYAWMKCHVMYSHKIYSKWTMWKCYVWHSLCRYSVCTVSAKTAVHD